MEFYGFYTLFIYQISTPKIANLKKNAKKRNPWGQVALQQ